MRPCEITTFTLSCGDTFIGWEVETELNQPPHADLVIAKLIQALDFDGLSSFIDYAMSNEVVIELSIEDDYGTHNSISYDPYQPALQSESENDISITLLREKTEVCLNEFLELKRTKNEEAAKS